jgi:N-acetylglutamate synthase-like GNAT family acetyltransferase
MSKPISDISIFIRHDLRPGDVGFITYLHGILYADQGWDCTFEAYVATPLIEFAKLHSSRQRIWIVESERRIVGSVAIVKHSENEAQLRWLLLDPEVRGLGLGRRLVEEALEFCREARYSSVFLWTVKTLPKATKLYQSMGFKQTVELTHELWGRTVTEIKYELALK